MTPSIGRIVVYRTLAGIDVPAIIVSVDNDAYGEPLDDGCVQVHVFWEGRKPDYVNDGGVPGPSDAAGHWRWPERV